MEEMHRKLEDIQNTQNSLIEKVSHVITDLFNKPDKELEKAINKAHTKASDTAEVINNIVSEYEERISEMKKS